MLGSLHVLFFYIPINELKKKIKFLAIASYTHPQGRNAKGEKKRMEREIWRDIERKRKRRKGGRKGRDIERGAWQEAKRCLNGIRMAGWLADCLAGG